MEEEEELLQVRQHLEHTVWSVGVHLGKDRQRSNKHSSSDVNYSIKLKYHSFTSI